jgi:tetrahydromethanopterin S-methyltransferase subunit B
MLTANSTYSGGMSIHINGNFTVVIPHDQFIFGEHYIDGYPNPPLTRSKTDVSQIPIERLQPGDDTMPSIGGMFFSSAYLLVNHDKKEFTITQVQTKTAPQKIMAFDTANNCLAAINAAAPPPKSPDTGRSSALSGGAIAGIVVGAVVGLLIVALIAFFFWKRKRAATSPYVAEVQGLNAAPANEKYRYDAAEDAPRELYADDGSHELVHGDHRQFAVEMDGVARPYEVPELGGMSPREGSMR